MKKILILMSLLSSASIVVYAAPVLDPETVLQRLVTEIFTPMYQLVVGLATVYFLYGAAKFIYDMKNPTDKNTGKQHLLWGMVGLFIILSVGGILGLFSSIFGNLGFN